MVNISSILCRSEVWLAALILLCSVALTACNSSNQEVPSLDNDPMPRTAAVPSLTFHSVKAFRFSWSDVSDANYA